MFSKIIFKISKTKSRVVFSIHILSFCVSLLLLVSFILFYFPPFHPIFTYFSLFFFNSLRPSFLLQSSVFYFLLLYVYLFPLSM